jgi:hypothetical protein
MRYLLFILVFLTHNGIAQTPCSGIDQQGYEKGIKSAEIKFEDQQLKLLLLTADKQRQVKVIPYN